MNLLNIKLAAAVVAAAAVTGTSTYLVKEKQADQLRADYRSLKEAQSRLATEQQQATATIQLRDEQIEQLKKEGAELPRLRGEVDKLNRDLAAMNKVRSENEQLRIEADKLRDRLQAAAADSLAEKQTELAEFQKRKMENINDTKYLGLVLRIYANDHQDSYPMGLHNREFQKQLSDFQHSATLDGGPQLSSRYRPDEYEQVYFGTINDVDPNIVLIRQRSPMISPDGERVKIYGLADGSAQTVTESMVGGSFEQFERNWTVNHKPILFVLPQPN